MFKLNKILLALLLILALFFSCQLSLEDKMSNDKVTIEKPNQDSLEIEIIDDEIIVFKGLEKFTESTKASKQSEINGQILNKDLDLIDLYKSYTGSNNVPEKIKSMNTRFKKIQEQCITNQQEDNTVAQVTETVDVEEENNKGYSYNVTYRPEYLDGDTWSENYGHYTYSKRNLTAYARVQAKKSFWASDAFSYRGTITHKVRIDKVTWRNVAEHQVPKGYRGYIGVVTYFRYDIKTEVNENDRHSTTGFRLAVMY